jgi:excinuclease ABC subunit B
MLSREEDDKITRPSRATKGALHVANPTKSAASLPQAELADLITELTAQMHSAAANLRFEVAARLRDEVADLKKEYRAMVEGEK